MQGKAAARLSPAEGRKFALTVGTAFSVLMLLCCRRHPGITITFGLVAAASFLAAFAAPGRLTPVWRSWMGLARQISRITTPLLMSAVYFLIFTPVGLLRRMVGRSVFHRGSGPGYWVRRTGQDARSDLEHQF